MPRIPLLRSDCLSDDQRRVYERIVAGPRGEVKGPLLAALHRPELADKWQQLGELLRYRTSLSPRHSELAILVTACKCACAFEWHVHEPLAVRAGVPDAVIAAVRRGARPRSMDPADAAIHDYAVELHERKAVTAATYQSVLERYGVVGVVELTALVGYYTMVAMTLNAHEFVSPACSGVREEHAKSAEAPASSWGDAGGCPSCGIKF